MCIYIIKIVEKSQNSSSEKDFVLIINGSGCSEIDSEWATQRRSPVFYCTTIVYRQGYKRVTRSRLFIELKLFSTLILPAVASFPSLEPIGTNLYFSDSFLSR